MNNTILKDAASSAVVFLVAIPLCLGIALASGAPLSSGLISGVVGGIIVGVLSGSHSSVSGPAAGLTAVVAAQIAQLGSFEAFLLALTIGGLLQIVLGILRAGSIAAFFPSSVIKGLLAAIGIIIILKQIPHLLGHDPVPIGEMNFADSSRSNTFFELLDMLNDFHAGAIVVGVVAILILVGFDYFKKYAKFLPPAPLVAVVAGVVVNMLLEKIGQGWAIGNSHLVQMPIMNKYNEIFLLFKFPDFSFLSNPMIYQAAITIAAIASLETLLNLEAVDKIDPEQRVSPPNRELIAQGVGNLTCGLIGGLPVTSVIVRSSININAGAKSKLSAIFHGVLLAASIVFLSTWLNKIPLSALAAVLIMTGLKLASPKLIKQMWKEGKTQFLPFIVTVLGIVLTDIMIGVLIGLMVSIGFILRSNLRFPIKRIMEKHAANNVLRIELANQVSFFSRAVLERTLKAVPRGEHVLIDARKSDYIDPDILDLIEDFTAHTAAAHGVEVSLLGFKEHYTHLTDVIQYVDYSTRELQSSLTPESVLSILKEGNSRFRSGHTLTRDSKQQINATAAGQYPLAVVLSCIDSRTPIELIFDLGLGDIFVVRIAGNVAQQNALGSIEFGCAVAGAKAILVLGHTSCGAVKAAVDLSLSNQTALQATGCEHLDSITSEIQKSFEANPQIIQSDGDPVRKTEIYDEVALLNVFRTMKNIREESKTIDNLIKENKIMLVGGLYNVSTGEVEIYCESKFGELNKKYSSADFPGTDATNRQKTSS